VTIDARLSDVRRRAGQMGGRAKSIAYAGRQHEATAAARAKYRRQFEEGTHSCRLGCKANPLPPDLLPEDRARAAEHALQLHLARMRAARGKGRQR
jgi:hypothetical protein